MAFVREDENGQLFYDWDYLLELTNEEFVLEVQATVNSEDYNVTDVQITEFHGHVTVFVKFNNVYRIYRYNGFSNVSIVLNNTDLETLKGLK